MHGQCEVSVLGPTGQESSPTWLCGPGGALWIRSCVFTLTLPSGLITMYFPFHTVSRLLQYTFQTKAMCSESALSAQVTVSHP